jgi:nicotinamide-nucleotide amidase
LDPELYELAERVGAHLQALGLMAVTAESCTGGWVAKVLTDVGGSSAWFERGFVTYSNAAKTELLGVSPQTLARFGAVSEQTVREMAEGALRRSRAQLAVAISGIAGPGGGTPQRPVGTVWLAWARRGAAPHCEQHRFSGDRAAVRRGAVILALDGMARLD